MPTELPTARPDANDPLSANAEGAGVWGSPFAPEVDPGAHRPVDVATSFDYSGGMFVGPDEYGANVAAAGPHPHLLERRTDLPPSYEAPHEATHRRYEPPFVIAVAQAAAGYTRLFAPSALHFVKVIACNLTLDAAGTIKFVQGPADGSGVSATAGGGDLSGLMNMGGAAVPPLNLPPADTASPWLFTSADQALGIFTVTGKAQGWLIVCQSPYES